MAHTRDMPDVTVVAPVYNTMPYLRRCLASLVGQSIGHDRMEIVAVDDGSTDGSGRELDRYAARYPGLVRVIRQPNSGGPAGPCNRALDVAAGRYVYFVGADDYLGGQALERLVAAADRLDADVVLGKVVGVNSRFVYQDVFARNADRIGLADSALPWSLMNVKLFRRDLLEQHAIRYPEDMPLGSDLPFTLEACYRARKISVVADYTCYHAVRRLNARNITQLSDVDARLACLRRLVQFTVGLIPEGPERRAVLARLFALEVAVLLRDDLALADDDTRRRVGDTIRELADQHLDDAIAGGLDIETWLRLRVLRAGRHAALLPVLRHDAQAGVPATVIEGDRWFAGYPGFRASPPQAPDAAFEVTDRAADWAARLDATDTAWRRDSSGARVLSLTLRSPLPDLRQRVSGPVRVVAEDIGADAVVVGAGEETTLRADLRLRDLVAASAESGQRRSIRATMRLGDVFGSAQVRATGLRSPRPALVRRGVRCFAVAPTRDQSGQLMISVVPVTPGRVVAQLVALARRRH
ncbi:glycosyltransferase family 2 protein [Pilimelia columellifera]|uniref:Glycosyl transferase n=1 Tax=Pilimelia columellifera subsp. columellifera TaxID=706583 RepID=A0ABP6B032_9ACTN